MTNTQAGWNLDNSYTSLPDIFYKIVEPNSVSSPKLVLINNSLSSDLGLDADQLKKQENIEMLVGNKAPKGLKLIAQAYGGHQFGHFTMLGDGRAMLIGEQITPKGERFDIQLKGSGPTPFSRGGDGRATLSAMLREYLISEAIHYLGIPSSRSLAVVETGEKVYRETPLNGAVLTRIASSHIRFGTFQYATAWGSFDDLKELADYTIKRHFPGIKDDENPYISLLEKVIEVQSSLIAKWKLVGFIHGVMNTDNMTVSGETIDYGPCAFMDIYDPNTVFSSIDRQGRYSYGNQSNIGEWNLARFTETLLPLIDKDKDRSIKLAEDALKNFSIFYQKHWAKGMKNKLGLTGQEPGDMELINQLLTMMKENRADYTNTFVALTLDKLDDSDLFKGNEFKIWKEKWQSRIKDTSIDKVKKIMKSNNPYIIPRNYKVEEALSLAVEGDYSVFNDFLNALKNPYDYSKEQEKYAKLPPISNTPYKTFCGT
jgi:protein adenylyltransferase